MLQHVDLQTSIHLWFMHDDAPPHLFLALQQFLNNVFPEQQIGRGGPTARPASSPELNPSHFYLWWHLQSAVCAAEVGDAQDLQQRTQNGFEMIRYHIWNFPTSQAVTVLTCNVLRWSSTWTLSIFLDLQKAHVHTTFILVLWCRFTCCRFDHTIFIHPVYSMSNVCRPVSLTSALYRCDRYSNICYSVTILTITSVYTGCISG